MNQSVNWTNKPQLEIVVADDLETADARAGPCSINPFQKIKICTFPTFLPFLPFYLAALTLRFAKVPSSCRESKRLILLFRRWQIK